MSQQPPPDDPPKEPKDGNPVTPSSEETKLEAIIEKGVERIPPDQIPTFLRDTMIAIIERGASPKIDPESFKIAAATVEKDNDNKLQYLMHKLDVEDGQHEREHKIESKQLDSVIKLLWPIVIAVIILVLGCISSGIYLAATGKETLGFSILSGTIGALFAYLGGLGTPRFWKS